jgi:hypothetical protein
MYVNTSIYAVYAAKHIHAYLCIYIRLAITVCLAPPSDHM